MGLWLERGVWSKDFFKNGNYLGTILMKIDPGAKEKLIMQEKDGVTLGVKYYSEKKGNL